MSAFRQSGLVGLLRRSFGCGSFTRRGSGLLFHAQALRHDLLGVLQVHVFRVLFHAGARRGLVGYNLIGGEVLLGRRVVDCRFDSDRDLWVVTTRDRVGNVEEFLGEHMVSSMPVRELIAQLKPPLSEDAIRAAQSLRYRDFLTVGLIVRDQGRFSDNWIYIHDPSVQVGRVQNYKSWSPEMVPDPAFCSWW